MDDLLLLVPAMRKSAERAYHSRLQTGTGGNLSIRVPGTETMLIKARGGSFADLRDEDIVLADFEGRLLQGSAPPSRELHTHALIYRSCPEAGAVFHSHSPWSIAVAGLFDQLPPVTMHMEMKLGAIPVLATEGHADDQMVADLSRFLGVHPGIQAFIQRRHGIFSMAEDIGAAELQAELVEECAMIAVLQEMTK